MDKFILQTVSIKDLKDHPKNPRQIGKQQFERLTKMIDKWGLLDKPIVNADMTIIGGHQRIRVLKKKKIKTVECMVAVEQLSDDDVEDLLIGLNLHQGDFDYDILGNMWDPIKLIELGFTEDQLLGDCKNEVDEEKKNSSKKKKCCPSCGHEF